MRCIHRWQNSREKQTNSPDKVRIAVSSVVKGEGGMWCMGHRGTSKVRSAFFHNLRLLGDYFLYSSLHNRRMFHPILCIVVYFTIFFKCDQEKKDLNIKVQEEYKRNNLPRRYHNSEFICVYHRLKIHEGKIAKSTITVKILIHLFQYLATWTK